jgi:anti-sigma B factor antagonist
MDTQLRTYEDSGAQVVEIQGDVELHSAARVREELRRACDEKGVRCIVDMSGVPFIDSTGVGVLVGALKRAREHSGTFAIANPQPRVRRVFEITGLLDALPIYDTLASAAQSEASAKHAVR